MEAEDNIQKMYKYFGILADAKENIIEVSSKFEVRKRIQNYILELFWFILSMFKVNYKYSGVHSLVDGARYKNMHNVPICNKNIIKT